MNSLILIAFGIRRESLMKSVNLLSRLVLFFFPIAINTASIIEFNRIWMLHKIITCVKLTRKSFQPRQMMRKENKFLINRTYQKGNRNRNWEFSSFKTSSSQQSLILSASVWLQVSAVCDHKCFLISNCDNIAMSFIANHLRYPMYFCTLTASFILLLALFLTPYDDSISLILLQSVNFSKMKVLIVYTLPSVWCASWPDPSAGA